ncbi:MAG TPA: biotin--[acetyl-CoA-carboxylase] ligase [Chthoniobacterales bacterium]|jgi:birA, biotin-[acetyl-CoA-carboxylase] ligase region|nr:biotin--[acetyl-CoA-carboxylase] ligase [Chthoniobacterales bacterium]
MPVLDAAKLRSALADCTIGREIVVLEETTSTNDFILQMTSPSIPEGLVVFAEHQTAGRGQRGNRWESVMHKGLWFSILLRPKIEIGESARLTAWTADTIANAIHEQFSLTANVKPPNDIYVDRRKVAGVLVEMRAQKNAPHLAIAGIGINVNQAPEDFSDEIRSRATSLAMAVNRQVNREEFAIALLRDLDRTYCASFGL